MRIAVICDLLEESWPSMDINAAMLLKYGTDRPGIELVRVRPALPAWLRPSPRAGGWGRTSQLQLGYGRYLAYPAHLAGLRGRFDWFHIVDHSYAHLALLLPRGRIGIFCHDLDTFRPLLENDGSSRMRTEIARLALLGLKRASVVFHTSSTVRAEIVHHGLVPPERLVSAPYGVGEEFHVESGPTDEQLDVPWPFLLHVSSLIPRKNPELLLELFARAKSEVPELGLVQIGGRFDVNQRAWLDARGLTGFVRQIERIDQRDLLAAYYRRALAVVMPSRSEGFGIPVIEALACGAPVIASDIPVFRSVGGDALIYCPLTDESAWSRAVLAVRRGEAPDRARRLAVADQYTWQRQAATILDASVAALSRT